MKDDNEHHFQIMWVFIKHTKNLRTYYVYHERGYHLITVFDDSLQKQFSTLKINKFIKTNKKQ